MQFYSGEQMLENETEQWSSSTAGDVNSGTMTFSSSTPYPVHVAPEDIEPFYAASLVHPTSKAHYHHHHRRHHHSVHHPQSIHFDMDDSLDSVRESVKATATSKLFNTAASMVQGAIDSVASPPPSSPYHSQYYDANPAADLFPTILSEGGVGSTPPDFSSSLNDTFGDSLSSDLAMNDSMNSTLHTLMEWPVRDPLYITIPITVIYVVILLIGLLGNVVTCIVIIRSRYLHTTTNYYLFSLAISDLLLLLCGLPVEMYSIWKRYPYIFGEYFCIGRGLAAETSSNATVLTITAFTIERYLAICRPFMIQKWQNKLTRVVRQILIIWMISISLAVPQALQFGVVEMPIGSQNSTFCLPKQPLIEHSFEIATFVFFVAPMILITVLYCLIGLTLRNASSVKESKLRLRKSLSNNKREVGQQRVLKMLVAVVVAFFVCWAPFHAQRLLAKFLEGNESLQTTFTILTYVSGVLYYLSTCINPCIYHIFSMKFRHAFQENVNRCCGERMRKRKLFKERELLVGPPSFSHSSHCSHSRSQGMALTEITPITLCSNHTHLNCHQANGSLQVHAHTKVKLEVKFQGSAV